MRKIIQLCKSNYQLVALCNDGTLLRERGDNSGWDIVDYEVPQPVKVVKGKVVVQTIPKNFVNCFDALWFKIGRNGSKSKARDIYTKMATGENKEDLEKFTRMLLGHIESQSGVVGFDALHLTTYLNQKRWEQ